jgi:hypothetical protein
MSKEQACEVCGGIAHMVAYDEELKPHVFCRECIETGAAIAHLEVQAG